jgi:hypothetical protein
MRKATHASLVLARFDDPRAVSEVQRPPSALFYGLAADRRAGKSSREDLRAFKFAAYGLHESEASARKVMEEWATACPWLADAQEVWGAVLRPFRHFGEANFIDPSSPGSQFDVTATPPGEDSPIVIVTSVGWTTAEGEAMERIQRFSAGVDAVRMGMTGLPGLHSQQSFNFPGGLATDGITVTLWKDLRSAMRFAYGPGLHRMEVKTQREGPYGDRTSFTRFTVLESFGAWHGSDPLGG